MSILASKLLKFGHNYPTPFLFKWSSNKEESYFNSQMNIQIKQLFWAEWFIIVYIIPIPISLY